MSLPLDGIRVLDLTRVLAGPMATMLLGDMGADIIKIERPGAGDDTRGWGPPFQGSESAYYLGANRNKRSVTLDTQTPQGQELLRQLISGSDVVVDNFKLGTFERWGFDDAWFDTHAPQVVRCSITGYGSSGPKAGDPGYDFILQAESGLMSITGEVDGAPMKIGVALVDVCTGLLASISILGGLQDRATHGRGRRYEVTLYDTSLMMLANVAANHLVSGRAPGRYGNGHPNIVPYRTFPCSDGEVAVAVGNDRQFDELARILEHAEWSEDERYATNEGRIQHRDEVDALVSAVTVTRTRDYWISTLHAAGIPVGPINSIPEALSSAQTTARGLVSEMVHPETGSYQLLGSPLRWSDEPAPIRHQPPRLGEQTDEILGELGLSADNLAALRSAGVI